MADALLPSRADVVVIGSGAFGLAAAYQLSRVFPGSIVVLDRFEPASQTSPRAAGLYKLIQASQVKSQLAALSIEIIEGFAEESGQPLDVVKSGSVLAARTPEHAAMIDAEVAQSREWGVEIEDLDAALLVRLAPYLTGRGVVRAYHVPGDVYIEEPAWLLRAYLAALAARNVPVVGDTPVTGITVVDGEVTGVSTPVGDIETPLVIDAAGIWSRQVGAFAGAEVPIAPVRHQLLITRPIAGLAPTEPIVRLVDASAYLRPARGGLMMGGMEPNALAIDPRQDPTFEMSQTPRDMRVLDAFTQALGSLTPALGDTPVAEHRAGVFTMTPDGRFLAGPSRQVRGLWLATGCNGSGFSLSAGLGRVLAEWIVSGEAPIDMSALDPDRFGTGPIDDESLVAAGLNMYSNYYTPAAAH
ncbi:MAG: FAD-binding oxidoreductase [Thermomicrobiales bacterium]|nr:FAD-binding oxidoreductase [Thermomicrobiales bacterium]